MTQMKGGMGAWLGVVVLIALALPLVSAENCCVDTVLESCSDVQTQTECTGTDLTYHNLSCSDVDDCQRGCCCAPGTTSSNLVWKIACDPNNFNFTDANEGDDCAVVCNPTVQTFILSGIVEDTDGNPLSNAQISTSAGSATSNELGNYNIQIPSGSYDVTATASGCDPDTQSVTINSNTVQNFALTCQGGGGGGPPPSECSVGSTENLRLDKAELIAGQLSVDLEWSLNSSCEPDKVIFSIMRSLGGGFNKLGETRSLSFTDNAGLEADKEYEYRIDALFPDNTRMNSNTLRVMMGSDACIGQQGDFCWDGNVNKCNSNNQLELVEQCSPKLCVETQNGAMCRAQGPCDKCNRLYGMYGHLDLEVEYESSSGHKIDVYCSDLEAIYDVCYLDNSYTTANPYKSCADVVSCNAYESKSNCGNDPCSSNLGCQWVDVYGQAQGNELGLGVCTSSSGSSCGDCENLRGGCTKQKCELLGDCVYNDGNCKPRGDLSCNDYRNQDDCEGNPASPVSVHAVYADGVRTAGTHQVTASNDAEGLGKCYWFAGHCFKDADNQKSTDFPDDCIPDDVRCATDFVAPTTTFDVHPDGVIGWNTVIEYSVSDNKYSPNKIETYYCLDSIGACYPNIQADPAGITLTLPPAGTGILKYYSMDEAKNLELVKSISLDIDATTPIISVTHNITSSGTKSSLEVHITVTDNSGYSSCSWNLRQGSTIIDSGSGSGTTMSYTDTFNDLSDGFYRLAVSCADIAGNLGTEEVGIRVLADSRINTFMPEGTFRLAEAQSKQISAKTNDSAICRYDADDALWAQMNNSFSTTGGTSHSNAMPGDVTGTGIYTYHIACTTGIQLIEGNPSHVIKFAVDETPPVTIGVKSSNSSGATVTMSCSDSTTILRDENGLDMSFGCKELYVCKGSGCTPELVNGTTHRLDLVEEGDHVIRFRSRDEGGNIELVQELTHEIDNTAPEFSSIQIIAPPQIQVDASTVRSSAPNGLVRGMADPDTVKVCVENNINGVKECSERCASTIINCVNENGEFEVPFEIVQSGDSVINKLTVFAEDAHGNEGRAARDVIRDIDPPTKPTVTFESE